MLGRKDYTQEEYDNGKSAVEEQLAAYKRLVKAVSDATTDKNVQAAFDDFEGVFFNNMTIVLDRYSVHRLRTVTGKDGNPLNEVELICESLMNKRGVMGQSTAIKYVPGQSVLKLNPGDQIQLSAQDFERLSAAFFAELERKFLTARTATEVPHD